VTPLYKNIIDRLLTQTEVTAKVDNSNTDYAAGNGRYAIRPGQLDANDGYPGIVLNLPTVEYEEDLEGLSRHGTATMEIRCCAFDLSSAWDLRTAVVYDTGDADAPAGLHTYDDIANGILSCLHQGDTEEAIEFGDASGRLLYVVEATLRIEFSEGDF